MTLDPFPLSLRRVLVLDLETSGLDLVAHGILEIGAAPLDPARAGETYHREIALQWWTEWDPGAEKVHGLTKGEASDPRRHSESIAIEQLLDWIDDTALGDLQGRAILAGANPRFDYNFLRAAAARADLLDRFTGLVSHRTIDLHTLAVAYAAPRGLYDETDSNPRGLDRLHTDLVYEMLGQSPEAKPHRALEGVRRESLALLELLSLLSNH